MKKVKMNYDFPQLENKETRNTDITVQVVSWNILRYVETDEIKCGYVKQRLRKFR